MINNSMLTESEQKIGILLPQLQYRWRLRVPCLSEEHHNRIATQSESIDIDYMNKKLTVTLVQNANDTLLHEAVIKMVSSYTITLHVDSLHSENGTPNYILDFDCKPVSHDFRLDYTQTGMAKHKIVFEYITMTPYNQKQEDE
jgi:hypothetical protein